MSTPGRTAETCPVCGAGVHPRDRYCPACGADVVANGPGGESLFDELMAPDTAGDRDDPAGAGWVAEEPAPRRQDPRDLEPEHSVPPALAARTGDTASYDLREPADPGWGGAGPHPDVPPPPREDDPGRGGLVLPLVIIGAAVVAAFLAWALLGRDGDDSRVAGTGGATTSSTSEASPSAEDSPPEDAGPEEVEMASTAARCDGAGDGVEAYRGNEVTSCEFAVEVAKALAQQSPDLPATVTARSPVTKQDYDMACENTVPVTCRGGDDALVYVDLG